MSEARAKPAFNAEDYLAWEEPVSYTHLDVYKRQESVLVIDRFCLAPY